MSLPAFVEFVGKLCARPAWGVEAGGLFGFATRVKLFAYAFGTAQELGSICYGGEAQAGKWLLQLTGRGCRLVEDWEALEAFLADLGAKLTRLDLAVDYLGGEYTVDDAVRMHEEGGFSSNGRPPTTAVAGDWLDGIQGRTLYVGKAVNGKMLRVYEKGKEQGDLSSAWVRYEVQFGNRDREIPLRALTERDAFFAGAYPALEAMLDCASETIPTTRTEARTSLGFLLYHLRRCYGKLVHALTGIGADNSDLIEEVRVIGVPRRVIPSGAEAGVEWSDVRDQSRRVS